MMKQTINQQISINWYIAWRKIISSNSEECNIGLIEVETPLRLGGPVAAISLPRRNSEPNSPVTLSGWVGRVYNKTDDRPKFLNSITVPIVQRDECRITSQKTAKKEVYETEICLGSLESDNNRFTCSVSMMLVDQKWDKFL